MSLNCGENPLLKAVQDAKNALKEKMAAIKVPGVDVSGALAEIKAAKAKLLADLKAAVPEIPKLPDFQKELDELKAAVAAKSEGWSDKLREFENSWGGAIEDIQETITALSDIAQAPLSELKDKLGNLDICKQEDVEGEPDPDNPGKLKKKDKPLKVQDSTEPPKEDSKPVAAMPSRATVIAEANRVSSSDVDALTASASAREISNVLGRAKLNINIDIKKSKKAANKLKTKAKKEFNKIPKSFKQKYPGALNTEYYIIEGVTMPDVVSESVYYYNRQYALMQVCIQVNKIVDMVLGSFGTRSGSILDMWKGSKWDTSFEIALAMRLYYSHGFGILEDSDAYGRKMESFFTTKEAKQFLKSAFDLKPYDYSAAKTPTIYSGLDIQNGGKGVVVKDYKKLLEECLDGIFTAEYLSVSALANVASYKSKRPLSDVLEKMPTKSTAFLPKALGGIIKNYEDIFIQAEDETGEYEEQIEMYTSSNFVEHWMYKGVAAIFVTSHAQHKQLAQLGYTHSQS